MLDLKAMRERCNKATKGPWCRIRKAVGCGASYFPPIPHLEGKNSYADFVMPIGIQLCGSCPDTETYLKYCEDSHDENYVNGNADFIAHSRSDIEQLLEAVETAIHLVNGAKTSVLNADWHDAANKFLARFK